MQLYHDIDNEGVEKGGIGVGNWVGLGEMVEECGGCEG